jgi:hypothetical protein
MRPAVRIKVASSCNERDTELKEFHPKKRTNFTEAKSDNK